MTRALDLYESAGELEKAAQIHSRLCRDLTSDFLHRDFARARKHFEAAEPVMRAGPDRVARGHWLAGGATLALIEGKLSDGLSYAEEALELADRLDKPALAANARILFGVLRRASGDLHAGDRELERGTAQADEQGASWVAFLGARLLTMAALTGWDPAKGAAIAEAEMAAPRLAQAPLARWAMRGLAIQCLSDAGQLDRARELRGEGRPIPALPAWDETWLIDGEFDRFESEDYVEFAPAFAGGAMWSEMRPYFQGLSLDARDMAAAAEAHLAVYAANASEAGAHGLNALWWLPALAAQRARVGKLDQARSDLAAAEKVLGPKGYRGTGTPIRRARAEIAAASGDLPTAEAELKLALENAGEWKQGFAGPGILRAWGRILLEHGDVERANERLDLAIEGYRRLGAGQPWIDAILALRPA